MCAHVLVCLSVRWCVCACVGVCVRVFVCVSVCSQRIGVWSLATEAKPERGILAGVTEVAVTVCVFLRVSVCACVLFVSVSVRAC